jgi:Uma2 family endonuclease
MPVTVQLPELPAGIDMLRPLTPDEFFDFCAANPDLRVELSPEGRIEFMPPCGLEADDANNEVCFQLTAWAKADKRGRANCSSAGFTLPDGSVLSADASWTLHSRRLAVPREQRRRFPRLVPDFIIEVMSPSDRLTDAQEKMRAWIANGVRLAWLLDVDRQTAHIYRPGARIKKLVAPEQITADAPVDGFVLDAAEVWDSATPPE